MVPDGCISELQDVRQVSTVVKGSLLSPVLPGTVPKGIAQVLSYRLLIRSREVPMITAAQARILANRKSVSSQAQSWVTRSIQTAATNGNFDVTCYHDNFSRAHSTQHLTTEEFLGIFEGIATKLTTLGFRVEAFPNKLVIRWNP